MSTELILVLRSWSLISRKFDLDRKGKEIRQWREREREREPLNTIPHLWASRMFFYCLPATKKTLKPLKSKQHNKASIHSELVLVGWDWLPEAPRRRNGGRTSGYSVGQPHARHTIPRGNTKETVSRGQASDWSWRIKRWLPCVLSKDAQPIVVKVRKRVKIMRVEMKSTRDQGVRKCGWCREIRFCFAIAFHRQLWWNITKHQKWNTTTMKIQNIEIV